MSMQAIAKKDERKRRLKPSAVEPQNNGLELKTANETDDEVASVSTVLSAREAWSKTGDGKQMMVVKRNERPDSAATAHDSKGTPTSHHLREERNVYIPYLYARNCIARMEDHMRGMHTDHVRIVADIQTVYKEIENDSEAQFKTFIFNLRDQYSHKLTTYRNVIEALRREIHRKEVYYKEVNQSLAFRIQHLLEEQNKALEKQKIDYEKMENDKHKLEQKISELESSPVEVVVTKEPEIKVIKDELESEKAERRRLEALLTAGVVGASAGAAVAVASKDENENDELLAQIKELEEENARLMQLPQRVEHLEAQLAALLVVASVADKEKTEREIEKLKADEDMLSQEKTNIEKDIKKWEDEFKKKNGRTPKESDRGDSQKELYTKLNETVTILTQTQAKSETLHVVSSGNIPTIVPVPVPTKVRAKTKIVKVRDHEIEAEVIRLRAELAAARKEKGAGKDKDTDNSGVAVDADGQRDEGKEEDGKDDEHLALLQETAPVVDDLRQEVDRLEAALREAVAAGEAAREESSALRAQNEALAAALGEAGDAAEEQALAAGLRAEIEARDSRLQALQADLDALRAAGLEQLPAAVQEEARRAHDQLARARADADEARSRETAAASKAAAAASKTAALERALAATRVSNADLEKKVGAVREEAAAGRKKLNDEWERKEARRAAEASRQVSKLKAALAAAGKSGTGGGRDADHVAALRRENADLARQLAAASRAGGGGSTDAGISATEKKKMEKILNELEKKLAMMKAKVAKLEAQNQQLQGHVTEAKDIINEKDKEIKALQAQLAALGVNAKEGADAIEKLKKLEKENKRLQEEVAAVTDNFNSERVLRKKYYNMVEDMKGKIRVYCRVRPLSDTEKGNGNVAVCKSPDEYTIAIKSSRGEKEFQFDTIFMPEHSQEKVFEDTYNLVQSAIDGYNVCIFAYGQTGSGKTFTMIGDRKQTCPGIAPRAFQRIFDLADENKSKFAFKISAYMLELYNDKLLDLFKNGAEFDDKLDIKKDKKGMVYVPGAEVKFAKSAKELYELFDTGSLNRHVASTKMNAESSRSHLIIGVMIESTNKASGQMMKGKLSIVDLAGSERVSKTGATAEQLKEANSINKSLSALGDVISALSSDQQFIPYRNNKLTMLMQDSLGGNAKTLMFVNISPADYNADESIISLTYASRVKLITNDAQKNADNKEISRLKSVIAKLKKGEAVNEDDED